MTTLLPPLEDDEIGGQQPPQHLDSTAANIESNALGLLHEDNHAGAGINGGENNSNQNLLEVDHATAPATATYTTIIQRARQADPNSQHALGVRNFTDAVAPAPAIVPGLLEHTFDQALVEAMQRAKTLDKSKYEQIQRRAVEYYQIPVGKWAEYLSPIKNRVTFFTWLMGLPASFHKAPKDTRALHKFIEAKCMLKHKSIEAQHKMSMRKTIDYVYHKTKAAFKDNEQYKINGFWKDFLDNPIGARKCAEFVDDQIRLCVTKHKQNMLSSGKPIPENKFTAEQQARIEGIREKFGLEKEEPKKKGSSSSTALTNANLKMLPEQKRMVKRAPPAPPAAAPGAGRPAPPPPKVAAEKKKPLTAAELLGGGDSTGKSNVNINNQSSGAGGHVVLAGDPSNNAGGTAGGAATASSSYNKKHQENNSVKFSVGELTGPNYTGSAAAEVTPGAAFEFTQGGAGFEFTPAGFEFTQGGAEDLIEYTPHGAQGKKEKKIFGERSKDKKMKEEEERKRNNKDHPAGAPNKDAATNRQHVSSSSFPYNDVTGRDTSKNPTYQQAKSANDPMWSKMGYSSHLGAAGGDQNKAAGRGAAADESVNYAFSFDYGAGGASNKITSPKPGAAASSFPDPLAAMIKSPVRKPGGTPEKRAKGGDDDAGAKKRKTEDYKALGIDFDEL
ncbi:unnamed protein product [Amoebophrya sp. A120]|nr:unnamed protein product [Amoebophrya sp. A120]|eukprot:GSA120T00009179001.1